MTPRHVAPRGTDHAIHHDHAMSRKTPHHATHLVAATPHYAARRITWHIKLRGTHHTTWLITTFVKSNGVTDHIAWHTSRSHHVTCHITSTPLHVTLHITSYGARTHHVQHRVAHVIWHTTTRKISHGVIRHATWHTFGSHYTTQHVQITSHDKPCDL
jgi:hypothetical protein